MGDDVDFREARRVSKNGGEVFCMRKQVRCRSALSFIISFAVLLAICPNASALSFDLDFGTGLSGNPNAQVAFITAASRWSTVLADDITVKLNLDYQSLSSGILGSASTTMLVGGFDIVRDIVSSNAGEINNARETALLPNLPTASQFTAWLPTGYTLNGNATLTQANYLALGGSRIVESGDGNITFSSNYNWDFDPSDGITSGYFDFVGVAAHEIGHTLGFVSEVDNLDWYLNNGYTSAGVQPTILDFFRFGQDDLDDPDFDFTTSPRFLNPGNGEQYSFFDDVTAQMSTGAYTGDGRQASHFKDNLGLGIMDPTAAPGELMGFSENDLIAFDLIGWDVVPEPTTIALFALGGLILRKRK